jgi:hypothetical protein
MDKIETTQMGSRRHSFVGVKGDLRVELHYASIGGGERQACLYLFKVSDPKNGVLVPFDSMWQYAQRDAIDKVVKPLAAKLYGFVTRMDEFRVLDAVMDYLEDLKNHKPEPGLDTSLDDFLESCEEEAGEFFLEVGGVRVI